MKHLLFSVLLFMSTMSLGQTFHTDFNDLSSNGYKINDSELGFSSWGRPGAIINGDLVVRLDTDISGKPPSGNGNLAYRCEAVWAQKFLNKPVGTKLVVEVPNDWKPDHKDNPEILIQLHGTHTPNLSVRVREDDLYVDIRHTTDDWRDAIKSSSIPFGPGTWTIEVNWLATKNNHEYFKVYINGEHLITHNGPTMYPFENKAGLRHQFGLYKDDWSSSGNRSKSENLGISHREYIIKEFSVYEGDVPQSTDVPEGVITISTERYAELITAEMDLSSCKMQTSQLEQEVASLSTDVTKLQSIIATLEEQKTRMLALLSRIGPWLEEVQSIWKF